MTTYTQRLHAFVPERTYTVAERNLCWCDHQREGTLPYAELTAVRLSFAPTRMQKDRYFLHLAPRRGKPLAISNEHYCSFGQFEDRSAAFRDFVFALHRAIAAANPGVRFTAGSTSSRHVMNWLMTTLIVLVILGPLFFIVAVGMVWIAVIKLVLIAYYLPTLRRFLVRNRPRHYDPHAIPEDILPNVAQPLIERRQ